MNQEDIIRMAREAGICTWLKPPEDVTERLERFAALVAQRVLAGSYPEMIAIVAAAAKAEEREHGQKWFDAVTAQHKQEILAEREACAKVCESTPWTADIEWWKQATKREVGEKSAYECAAAIRARGETK